MTGVKLKKKWIVPSAPDWHLEHAMHKSSQVPGCQDGLTVSVHRTTVQDRPPPFVPFFFAGTSTFIYVGSSVFFFGFFLGRNDHKIL